MLIAALIITIIVLCIVTWGLWRVLQHNFYLVDKQDETSESIEAALAQLRFIEQRFENKSKMDLFLDEPVIRDVMEDIKITKELLGEIAKTLESSLEEDEKED